MRNIVPRCLHFRPPPLMRSLHMPGEQDPMTISVNEHVDHIALLIVVDGHCLKYSFTVARVVQISLDTNTVVSTCRWAETPVDDSELCRKLVSTGLKAMGLKKTPSPHWRRSDKTRNDSLGHLHGRVIMTEQVVQQRLDLEKCLSQSMRSGQHTEAFFCRDHGSNFTCETPLPHF